MLLWTHEPDIQGVSSDSNSHRFCVKMFSMPSLSREMGHSVTDLQDCHFPFILLTWFCFVCFLLSHQKLLIQFYPVSLCQILPVFETEGSSFFKPIFFAG